MSGGNFWEGAAIGVMTAGLNHLQNRTDELLFCANATPDGKGFMQTGIDFYDSGDGLKYSLGRATLKYRLEHTRIDYAGFKDEYNFNPLPWGTRPYHAEVLTRIYSRLARGTDYMIYYNKAIF